ncbi:MAG: asparagine synthase (glutamine-hydrolyzing) [Lentisphaerae bacterium GWF2_52_8]|nr:MAG: asparagine synthase (glutamine-hydrolyzing) [Lentisphaerae bacterium GWF2_52_8]
MCGIAGYFSTRKAIEDGPDRLGKMCEALRHRGPDDHGQFVQPENGIGLAMRRLSIIDINGGHQPMRDPTSGISIVFNGEIYNYRELAKELESSGVRLESKSDTEVLLKEFSLRGPDCLSMLNGMFAFAAWDERRRRLFLARDRIGVKPLYYMWQDGLLVFASEIKGILASGLVSPKMNRQAVWDYLSFRFVPGPETIWDGIMKLQPGHCLSIGADNAAPRIEKYWGLYRGDGDFSGSEAEAQKCFAGLFEDAVKLRLESSDVPVGVFLSGGLDSSAIASAAVGLGHKNFHTFSIGYKDSEFSELPFAREVSKSIGSIHHEAELRADEFPRLMPTVQRHADEPLADLTCVPLLILSREAAQHVKVVMGGEGADEFLGGYDFNSRAAFHKLAGIARQFPGIPQILKSLSGAGLGGRALQRLALATACAEEKANRRCEIQMSWVFDEPEKAELFAIDGMLNSWRITDSEYASIAAHDPVQQLMLLYQHSWLVEDLLMKGDKMTMAASLEMRCPFLDYRLADFANRLPSCMKVKGNSTFSFSTKNLLREYAKGRIPESIIKRPKRGFPLPAYAWLAGPLKSWVEGLLRDSQLLRESGRKCVMDIMEMASRGDADSAHKVWNVAVMEIWMREWNAKL